MERGIQYSELSKTVQDAMNFTRQLGFQYIWVDYLCILQDSPTDWAQEAATMKQVYSHSSCTLAATAASDGSEGLFFQREVKFGPNYRNTSHSGSKGT